MPHVADADIQSEAQLEAQLEDGLPDGNLVLDIVCSCSSNAE